MTASVATQRSLRTFAAFVLSAGSLSAALVFYLGRRYAEAYYEMLGIPSSSLSFDAWDFAYIGLRSWLFLVAVACSVLLVALWTAFHGRMGEPLPQESSWRKTGQDPARSPRNPSLIGVYLLLCLVVLGAYVAYLGLLGDRDPRVSAVLGLIVISVTLGSALLGVSSRPVTDLMRAFPRVGRTFVVASLLSVVVAIQFFPASWGAFIGLSHLKPLEHFFPKATLVSKTRFANTDLAWREDGNGTFETTVPLVILLHTDDHIFAEVPGSLKVLRISNADVTSVRYAAAPTQAADDTDTPSPP